VSARYSEKDLAAGRAALLSGWSTGSEPGLVITKAAGTLVWDAVIGIAINLLSAGIAANVVSICSVAYYFVYALTVGGALYAHFKKKIPGHRAGDFSLGRWFPVVAIAALVYGLGVIIIALAPHEGHTAALYLGGAEIVGLLWYLLYLRPRIMRGTSGVTREQVAESEEHATAIS
jgi:amino acid transporter